MSLSTSIIALAIMNMVLYLLLGLTVKELVKTKKKLAIIAREKNYWYTRFSEAQRDLINNSLYKNR